MKEIAFDDGTPAVRLPRSACVTQGDEVLMDESGLWVACANGFAQLLPVYAHPQILKVGGLRLEFIIKEVTEPEEFSAYQALTQLHYRGHMLRGRTARLVVRNFNPLFPQVVGFVELATPFYMNKARAALLDAPFRDGELEWEKWDMATQRRYVHLIARIARCVVFSEFRGIGLGQALVRHAAAFAKERWQSARLKPSFLEISADMLKFVPFAERAGMVYAGETQGNLQRVAGDMEYLLRNRSRVKSRDILKEEACGIVDTQVARMDRAAALIEQEGWDLAEFVQRLGRLSTNSVLREFDRFHGIVSLPKPNYMSGLTEPAKEFLTERIATVGPKNGHVPPPIRVTRLDRPLILRQVSLDYSSSVRRTKRTHAIQQAFDISPDAVKHRVIDDMSLNIDPGEIVLVTGPSGSGKTSLLRLLSKQAPSLSEGEVSWPTNYVPGVLAPIRSRKPLIDTLGDRAVKDALHIMGLVGLSDAFVFLKRFEELSAGQQYRAMLARLLASSANVWFADEFCSNLDTLTARVVADRLQRVARGAGAVLVVASSQPEIVVEGLRPDKVVQLTTAWEHRVMTGNTFVRSLDLSGRSHEAPSLTLAPQYLPAVRSGLKRTTIRRGHLSFQPGMLVLRAARDFEVVRITSCRSTRFGSLTDADAAADGFASLPELRLALQRHYRGLQNQSPITIVAFERLVSSPASSVGRSQD